MREEAYEDYAFVVLFDGDAGSRVEMMLRTASNPEPEHAIEVVRPGGSALEFLSATGEAGDNLDRWWRKHLPPTRLPVYLALYEDALEDWIRGTDGCWFVGVPDGAAIGRLRTLAEPVFPVVSDDPEVVSEQAMQAIEIAASRSPSIFHPGFPYRHDPLPWPRAVPDIADRAAPSTSGSLPRRGVDAVAVHEARGDAYFARVPPRPAQPISYDVEPAVAPASLRPDSTVPPAAAGTGAPTLQAAVSRLRGGSRRMRAFLDSRPRADPSPSPRLGLTINANRPIVAGFASRKGGVGKTTHAAAVAATVGEALDGFPDTAALVDGNITNPDSWALNPPAGSATVRTLVSRLTQSQDPPPEQYARTPRLAIYPESRESEELYTQAEIDAVAGYLRRRHAFIAVDLPNALPSLTSGGPGAAAAAWLVHCDILVLPFNADPRARQGLLEYVAAVGEDRRLAPKPILAPYIVSANRAISSDPAVQRDIAELRRRGVEVTEVPDDENALLALLKDLPINQASPGLRRAYLQMTESLVDIVLRSRNPA